MSIEQAAGSPYEVRVMRQDDETVVLRNEAGETKLLEHNVNLLQTYEDVILSSPEAAGFSSTAWRVCEVRRTGVRLPDRGELPLRAKPRHRSVPGVRAVVRG